MTEKEIKGQFTEICNSLSNRRLKPAFDRLGELISENGLGIFYDEYKNLEDTYQSMLKYTVEGIHDPERQKIYRKLIVSVFELADTIREDLLVKNSSSLQYNQKRSFRKQYIPDLNDYFRELDEFFRLYNERVAAAKNEEGEGSGPSEEAISDGALKEQQQKIRHLFYHIWFSDKMTSDQVQLVNNFLTASFLPVHYRSFLVTAIMLSLQRFFSKEKFNLLLDLYSSEEPEINQRALVGLLINFYRYDARMQFYQDITDRLKLLGEKPEFRQNLERIIIQFIRSKETEKLQKRIREEILPEMIKISPNLKNKINLDSLMEEGLSEDKNPDWEDVFKDSPELLNKMEEFSEMQMKGDDVFMGSFSMLKSFPFFNEISNWFIPFFPDNPEISDTLDLKRKDINQLVKAIKLAPILCNSDKYSFSLSVQRLPEENLSFMTQAMQSEMEQIKEITEDEAMLDSGRKAEFISNQYIQDLYRFYKLFPRKNEFEDVFGWRLDFHNTASFGSILKEDRKMLRNIAEYYFVKEHFDEAATIFENLLKDEKNEELYQKAAWCYEKQGDYAKALDNYLTAELHGADNLWNIRKIALCYRNLKKPEKALEYYRTAEKIDPENLNIQLNIGHSLLELDKYEDALKTYFKVEYLAPGNKKVWRPIGWCSFLSGKKDQAEKYFLKLMDEEPNKHDLINMGHVQWSFGNRRAALEYYKLSITKKGFSEEEFLEVFEEDLPHLLDQGIDREDVPIMLDQLRYFLAE